MNRQDEEDIADGFYSIISDVLAPVGPYRGNLGGASELLIPPWGRMKFAVVDVPQVAADHSLGKLMVSTCMDDTLTRWTARLAMALYAVALAGVLSGRSSPRPWVFRVWAAGCLTFFLHVVCAFHEVHGWSHVAAYEATAQQVKELFGFSSGAGLYLNYVFAVLWAGDVLWWWCWPERYRRRLRWLNISVHAFLAFMAFNATVVFGTPPTRWLGSSVCLVLAGLWWFSRA